MDQPSSTLLTPDLCIVGAGYAGMAVANGAAALGVPTVVVDRQPLAQALPRAGDIATEVLRTAARRYAETANAAPSACDWTALRSAAAAAAASRTSALSATHLRALGHTVLQGTARFLDARTLEAGGVLLRPRRFVLATGAVPAVPTLPGLDQVSWTSADRWLDLPVRPAGVIVLGAGRTGVELAQILGRLGCAVTLVDDASPLRGFDPELSRSVLDRLRRDGIDLRCGSAVLRVEAEGRGVLLMRKTVVGEETLRADHLILATGRRPAIDELGLDRAGIRRDPAGVMVGSNGRTSNPRVFALGDVVGRGRSIEAAELQAGVVLRAALFRQPASYDARSVPRRLRTDPAIAAVGLSEAEARGRFGPIGVWRWPYAETDRARAEGVTTGHVKVMTAARGRIVGAGIVGPEAAEVIAPWVLAIAKGLTLGDMASLPLPADGYADLTRRVAMQAEIARLKAPWLRRTLRIVRWLD